MDNVKGNDVLPIRGGRRGRGGLTANQASGRRLSSPRGGGRAWINGREVGGADKRWAHLQTSYD